jgi:hypothetical protein
MCQWCVRSSPKLAVSSIGIPIGFLKYPLGIWGDCAVEIKKMEKRIEKRRSFFCMRKGKVTMKKFIAVEILSTPNFP